MEDVLDRLWEPRREWLRPVVGGLVLGLLLLVVPQLYGVGYAPLEQAISGNYSLQLLLVLLVGKAFATSLTIGIGGSGGVFAPSLFLGGMLGTAFGMIASAVLPGQVADPGAYGLVGMGAVFAAASHAPITAVLILFELTGDYQIILPMMTAIAVAAGVSSLLSRDTIYTLKLRRRGIDVLQGPAASPMTLLTVREAMRPVPPPVTTAASLTEIVDRLVTEGVAALPVVSEEGTYRGIVTSDGVEEQMRTSAFDATAADLAQSVPAVHGGETLEQALDRLLAHGAAGLPVLSADDQRVIGWLTHHDLLRAYSTGGSTSHSGSPPAAPSDGATAVAPGPSWLRRFRIVDLDFTSDEPPVGNRLTSLPWPALSLPILLRRGGRSLALTEHTVLQARDRVTVLVDHELADELADRIATPRPDQPPSATRADPEDDPDGQAGLADEAGRPTPSA